MFIVSSLSSRFKRHPWRYSIGGIVLLLLVGYLAFGRGEAQPEYITAPVERGDLQQTVEAVGTVISERDLELKFGVSGIVGTVNVKTGDRVVAGQRLATLRSGTEAAQVAAASARLAQASADYRQLQEGTRSEDIAIAQADLENSRAALQVAQIQKQSAQEALNAAEVKLDSIKSQLSTEAIGQTAESATTIGAQITKADAALTSIDDTFSNNDLLDAIQKDNPNGYNDLRKMVANARAAVDAMRAKSLATDNATVAITNYQSAIITVQSAAIAIDAAYNVITGLPQSTYFDASDREAYGQAISAQRTLLDTSLSSLTSAINSLQDLTASQSTQLATEEATITASRNALSRAEADILTYQAAIRSKEASLAQKQAGPRKTELESAAARVREAQASLASAQAGWADTVITAPSAGNITKVDIKPGEITPAGAAITMLGDSPFRIEMFVSEIDIPKVVVSQKASVELDAFPDIHMALVVNEIDTAPTEVDGVLKYRVKMDLVHRHDELKIGMSGDVTIITGERSGIIMVPRRSVLKDDDERPYVRLLSKSGAVVNRYVEMGMEGVSGNVEIRRGLTGSGETVIQLTK